MNKKLIAIALFLVLVAPLRAPAADTHISHEEYLAADVLTAAGVTRVLAMDLHAGQIQGFFNIPVDHLYAMPVQMDHLKAHFNKEAVIVSPDAGGVERARAFSKRLNCGLAIIDKRRPAANVAEVVNIIGEVEGRDAIIVDDLIDTAGTLCAAAKAIKAGLAEDAAIRALTVDAAAICKMASSCGADMFLSPPIFLLFFS